MELMSNTSNLDVVCALSGIKNYYSKKVLSDYKYDIGNIRPLWSWYDYININYDIKNKDIG